MARYCFLFTTPLAIVVACTTIVTPSPIPTTITSTPTKEATSTDILAAPTKIIEPTTTEAPRELVICTGAEPDTLYLYSPAMHVASNVQEAVYDGPNSSFVSSDTWNIEEYDYGEGCE